MYDDNEIKNQYYKKVRLNLCYIINEINFFIIFLSIIIIKSKTRNIKILKVKLSILITIETISVFFYTCFAHIKYIMNLPITELFFKSLATIEFYLYISFIYQIINNTKISNKPKKVKLINSFHLSVLFLVITLSYNKYLQINQKIINLILFFVVFYFFFFICKIY